MSISPLLDHFIHIKVVRQTPKGRRAIPIPSDKYQDYRMNYWAGNWSCHEPMLEAAVECHLQVASLVQDVSKPCSANSALPD
jgi:hypothetical protein